MIEVVSFPPFNGKINVDNVLQQKFEINDVLNYELKYISYVSSWNEAYHSYNKKN